MAIEMSIRKMCKLIFVVVTLTFLGLCGVFVSQHRLTAYAQVSGKGSTEAATQQRKMRNIIGQYRTQKITRQQAEKLLRPLVKPGIQMMLKNGAMDQRIAEIEERLAEARQLKRDPKLQMQQGIDWLLDKARAGKVALETKELEQQLRALTADDPKTANLRRIKQFQWETNKVALAYHQGKIKLKEAQQRIKSLIDQWQGPKGTGNLDLQIKHLEQELAKWKNFKRNPELLVQQRIEQLLREQPPKPGKILKESR